MKLGEKESVGCWGGGQWWGVGTLGRGLPYIWVRWDDPGGF